MVSRLSAPLISPTAPGDATQMYASNMFNLVEDTWDTEAKQFVLDLENDILPVA